MHQELASELQCSYYQLCLLIGRYSEFRGDIRFLRGERNIKNSVFIKIELNYFSGCLGTGCMHTSFPPLVGSNLPPVPGTGEYEDFAPCNEKVRQPVTRGQSIRRVAFLPPLKGSYLPLSPGPIFSKSTLIFKDSSAADHKQSNKIKAPPGAQTPANSIRREVPVQKAVTVSPSHT